MAAAYGLAPDEALRAVTLSPAEILGVADRYGSLEKDKSATLLVTDGNPLEVGTVIERAYIDGRLIDLSTKQSVLAAKYRERYKQMKAAEDMKAGKVGGNIGK
jgi:cytosine/adenosine deaminase-related metal-dependent hydrolase